MRRLVTVASLALVLSAADAFAQAPAAQQPTAPRPTPAAPALTTPPPAQPAAAPVPPAVFPPGAKIGYIDFQRVAQESIDGQSFSAKINALVAKKQAEGGEKAKQLQLNQQKLAQSGAVMSDAARAQLEKDIERQTREGERFQQDAQAEITELQQELQLEFQKKIMPVVQQVFQEKALHMLLSRADAGIVLADPGLDLTVDVVKKLDAMAPKPTAAPAKTATPPAAAAPRPTPPVAPPATQKP
jgi:Skp family chaperone for outer membrane proteins